MGAYLIGIVSLLRVIFSEKPQYVEMRKETGAYLSQRIEKPILEACERVHNGEPLFVKKPPAKWRSNKQMALIIALSIALVYLLSWLMK